MLYKCTFTHAENSRSTSSQRFAAQHDVSLQIGYFQQETKSEMRLDLLSLTSSLLTFSVYFFRGRKWNWYCFVLSNFVMLLTFVHNTLENKSIALWVQADRPFLILINEITLIQGTDAFFVFKLCIC